MITVYVLNKKSNHALRTRVCPDEAAAKIAAALMVDSLVNDYYYEASELLVSVKDGIHEPLEYSADKSGAIYDSPWFDK